MIRQATGWEQIAQTVIQLSACDVQADECAHLQYGNVISDSRCKEVQQLQDHWQLCASERKLAHDAEPNRTCTPNYSCSGVQPQTIQHAMVCTL